MDGRSEKAWFVLTLISVSRIEELIGLLMFHDTTQLADDATINRLIKISTQIGKVIEPLG